MIEKSLFYQKGRKPYIMESLESDKSKYLFQKTEKPIEQITLPRKPKDIRDFIYTNFQAHKREFNAAFAYEMSSIYAALKNVDIRLSTFPKYYNSSKANYSVCSFISINKKFYKEIQRIILLEDDNEIEITNHQHYQDKELVDLMEHVAIKTTDTMMEYPKKDTKLLIQSDSISLKYDVIYFYDAASNYKQGAEGGALKITNLQSLPLTKNDCKILNIGVS